jgi:hypothetical protein
LEKKSILAKVTQVSDVAHGPLVNYAPFEEKGHIALHLSVGWSVDQTMSTQYLPIVIFDMWVGDK